MTLMIYFFDKHIYDVMFMHFLLASYLWNKLSMNLSIFLTHYKLVIYDCRQCDPI